MKLKNPKGWQEGLDNNQDSYGSCCYRYAEAWANLMEEKMDAGADLKDIAKDTSHEADTEGITGFMYGCAVQALAYCWEHGEELRQWHNLDSQIGSEGEEANESGHVLNPAIMKIE